MSEIKEIEFRELNGGDIFLASAILDAIGIDPTTIKLKGKEKNQLGFEILYSVFRKLHKAKKEVNAFLADLTGLTVKEIEKLPIKEYSKLIKKLKELNGLMELFN